MQILSNPWLAYIREAILFKTATQPISDCNFLSILPLTRGGGRCGGGGGGGGGGGRITDVG